MTHPQTRRQLLQISRGLRNFALPLSELPTVPMLLQRLDLRDHELFEEFCAFSARKWKELPATEMAKLFRNTEDYHLLHATKGTALCRLVASLTETIQQRELQHVPNARALASLCHGALAPKRRAALLPLLAQLRAALQLSLEASALNGGDAVELLAAAAELHRAIGVSTPTLTALAKAGQEALRGDQVSFGQLSLLARASRRLAMVLPYESDEIMKALIETLRQREASERERVFPACRQLPAHLRRHLAESGLLQESGTDFKASLKQLETRVHILHDLPLHLVTCGGDASHMTVQIKAILSKLLDASANSTAALGYMAATTVLHTSAVAKVEGDPDFQRMSQQFLRQLRWAEVTPQEVQWLFRSPGDVSEAALEAAKNAHKVQDAKALAALLQAAKAMPETGAALAEATRAVMLKQVKEMTNATELSVLEAATRKGPAIDDPEDVALREGLRRRLFKSILDANAIFDARPNRGFVRFVEKCLAKDRQPQEETPIAPSGEVEPIVRDPVGAQELTATEMRETRETHRDVLEQKEGVKWHTGVEGWEVKIDVAGRSIRGGYFIPKKEEDEASPDSQNKWEKAVKEELENAVKCRENLERRYREAE